MPLEVAPVMDLRRVVHPEVAVRYRKVLVNLPHDHGDVETKQNPMKVDEEQQNSQDSLCDHLWQDPPVQLGTTLLSVEVVAF